MKTGLLAEFYRKLGEGLGLLEQSSSEGLPEYSGSEAEIREGLLALEGLRKAQLKMRKAGITRKEVMKWVREDRRV